MFRYTKFHHIIYSIIAILFCVVFPNISIAQTVNVSTQTVSPSKQLLSYDGLDLTIERLQSLVSEIKTKLYEEERKEKPSESVLGFQQRRLNLFNGIVKLYQEKTALTQKQTEIEQALTDEKKKQQQSGDKPKLANNIPISDDGLKQIETVISTSKEQEAKLEQDALSLTHQANKLQATINAMDKNLQDAVFWRQKYEKELSELRQQKRAAAAINMVKERIKIRELASAFYQRRMQHLSQEQLLSQQHQTLVQLKQTNINTEIQHLNKIRAELSTQLNAALEKQAADAEIKIQTAERQLAEQMTPYAKLRAEQRVAQKQIEAKIASFAAEYAHLTQPANELLTHIKQLSVDYDLVHATLQRYKEDAMQGLSVLEQERIIAQQLHRLRKNQRRLQPELIRELNDLHRANAKIEREQASIKDRIMGVDQRFQSYQEHALQMFKRAQEESRRQGNSQTQQKTQIIIAERQWQQEVLIWNVLAIDTRKSLKRLASTLDKAHQDIIVKVLGLNRQQPELEEIGQFIKDQRRYIFTDNRITISAITQIPGDLYAGTKRIDQFVRTLPERFYTFIHYPNLLSTLFSLGVAIIFSLMLFKRLSSSIGMRANYSAQPLTFTQTCQVWCCRAVHKGLVALLLGALALLTLMLLPIGTVLSHVMLIIVMAWFIYYFTNILLGAIARATTTQESQNKRDEGKIAAHRHLIGFIRRLQIWSLFWLPNILILQTLDYDNYGVLDLSFSIYVIGVFCNLIHFLWHRHRILKLVELGTGSIWQVVRILAHLLRPLLMVLSSWILLVYVRGYHEYSLDLLSNTLLTLFIMSIAPMAVTLILETMHNQKRYLNWIGFFDRETCITAWSHIYVFLRWNLIVFSLIASCFLITLAWDVLPARTFEMISAPLPWVDPESTHPTSYQGLFSALLIIFFTFFFARLVRELMRLLWLPMASMETGIAHAITTLIHYTLLLIGLVMAANSVNISTAQLQWLFAFAGIGIGFGMQEIVTNFIAGIIMLFERPVKIGDVITVGDTEGTIETINIRSTTVRSTKNIDILIPNKRFITEDVINWTHRDKDVWIGVKIGVSYDADVKLVRETLLEVARNHGQVIKERLPLVRFINFGDSSLDFKLVVCINSPMERYKIESDLRFAIRAAFNRAEIEIPFPQRDLHIDMQSLTNEAQGKQHQHIIQSI